MSDPISRLKKFCENLSNHKDLHYKIRSKWLEVLNQVLADLERDYRKKGEEPKALTDEAIETYPDPWGDLEKDDLTIVKAGNKLVSRLKKQED